MLLLSSGSEEEVGNAQGRPLCTVRRRKAPRFLFAIETFVTTIRHWSLKALGNAELGRDSWVRAFDIRKVIPLQEVYGWVCVNLARDKIPVQYGCNRRME